jgi:hypothetical protein
MEFKKVKLPRKTKEHPVLALSEYIDKEGMTLRYAAKKLFKVSEQSLFAWIRHGRHDRDFNVPPRQVIKICRLTGQPPYVYNPDLWPNPEWRV